MALSLKHLRFVAEYLKDQCAMKAAIRAGYTPGSAQANAHRLMDHEGIKSEIRTRLEALTEAAGLTRQDVIEGWRRVIHADIRKLHAEDGSLLPLHTLRDEEAWMIAGSEHVIKNAAAGDGHTDTVLKVRLVDRARYLEMAAKHFGMLDDKVEHSGSIEINWKTSE